ncbi:voltage-dependent anion-selective channel-like [Drosophila kikkawai]|uniref:Voltage-dependent anion-selective channel-like n=1 Tax=Drosophila kikkawai TaxID=30033 RepID=A0A6P4IPN4_DROKI|nr:voltage-dependent anion-selective channel-like [Drosophila kikkawai]
MEKLKNFFRCKRRKSEAAEKKDEKAPPPQEEGQEESQGDHVKENLVPIVQPPTVEGEVPSYFQVNALANMSLLNGYENGVWKLQTTTKTKSDLFLSSFGEGYPFLNNAYGGVEALQEMGPFHAALCWLTNQEFLLDLGANDEALSGQWFSVLKFGAATAEELQFTAKLRLGFERNPIKMELEVPIYRQPLLKGYLMVVPVEHFALGYRTVFDVNDKKFGMHAFCVGFNNQSTEISLKLENFEHLRGTIFQRLFGKWALALKTDIYGNVDQRNLHVGCQYEWGPGTLIKTKIRGDARLGFIVERKLSEAIRMVYNCSFDGKDPLNGEIRMGAAWYFNLM